MQNILDWNGRDITVVESDGAVRAVVHFADNLVRTGVAPWPPGEIIQKLYKSDHQRSFMGPDRAAAIQVLSFYSDLQSLHSEDAITWSVFGPLAYDEASMRCRFVESLFRLIELPVKRVGQASVWLWRRVPHPDTQVSGGPEIDFGIYCDEVLVLGESKWRGKFAVKQGKAKNKDQLVLRQDFLQKHAASMCGQVNRIVVLAVSWHGNLFVKSDISLSQGIMHLKDLTWDSLISETEHPLKDELGRYLKWKKDNSKPA